MTSHQQEATVLDRILAAKADEVAQRKGQVPLVPLRDRAEAAAKQAETANRPGFKQPLADYDAVAVIAEVKRASPSKGLLAPAMDARDVAEHYRRGGAAAISVVTDTPFFRGRAEDFHHVREHVPLPLLRKDFIIDEYQLYESRLWGADAVLLIVAALDGDRLANFLSLTRELQMDALVEVHTRFELERALAAGATLIGINNRDLRTFETNLDVTKGLASLVPPDRVLISESGIQGVADAETLAQAGVDGLLIGELFVTQREPEPLVHALSRLPKRKRPPHPKAVARQ